MNTFRFYLIMRNKVATEMLSQSVRNEAKTTESQ